MMQVDSFKQYVDLFKDTEYEIDVAAKKDKINRILELRDKKNVLILGHNYMEPLVYHLSPEEARGDSLALSRYAAETDAPIILFDGVRFMAETAKILSPDKKVLIASKLAGCSLADPIRAEQVKKLKEHYPDSPVVTYINSYADVKAESDIICTSANALNVVRHIHKQTGQHQIIFLPDSLMGKNLQYELDQDGDDIELIYPGRKNILPEGKCEVHEKFTVADIQDIRKQYDIPKGHPNRAILAHWECPPEVIQEADFHGSTTQMSNYIRDNHPERVYLATECEMAANLEGEFPDTEFAKACRIFCQHMRQITIDGILSALETEDPEKHEITVDEEIRKRALIPLNRMLEVKAEISD